METGLGSFLESWRVVVGGRGLFLYCVIYVVELRTRGAYYLMSAK